MSILVSRRMRSGSSSDSTTTRGSRHSPSSDYSLSAQLTGTGGGAVMRRSRESDESIGRLPPQRRRLYCSAHPPPPAGSDKTYRRKRGRAEAGPSVEPVIVAQLVDLDAPLVLRLMRHVLCHHQCFLALFRGETGRVLKRQTDACRIGREEQGGLRWGSPQSPRSA